ncbi:SgcJ/EcaC family oxidoreductase [Sphingomonas bacterium]|uniref:SgcJ/EcaC family oxidoreductase n=1 Tax=Sphingomonas bacterium TaxID=1895847 RepID=UPI001575EBDA|nr:SgcJ/EcaC family oxidoreductase [Sphingomonas bacterium]
MTDTIESLFDDWNGALQTRDPDRVAALYADDAILLPTLSNQVRRDRTAIVNYFVGFLKKQPRGVLTQSNVRVFGEIAINSGLYVFTLTDGGVASEAPCRFTFVYRREGDGWKIIEHHSSQMPE